jgi:hypothetical protein
MSRRPETLHALRWCGTSALIGRELDGSSWSTGYAFAPDGRLLEGDAIGREHVYRRHDLARSVAALDGCFAAVLVWRDEAAIVQDRWGSTPVFHAPAGGSDDLVDGERLGAVLCRPDADERVFQVLLAGALTVDGVAVEARRVWRAARH